MEHRIERLEELAIALNAEIEKAAAALPEIKAELQAFLAGRVAELAAVAKGDAKADVRAQCEAIRFEVAGRIDTHMAAILAKRQEVCQLAEIEPALKSFAERAAAGVLREFAKENDTKLESIRHEFAKAPKFKHEFAVGGAALADAMKGNWDKDTTYKRGEIFTFRGSSYLVMRESRGVLPTQQEQKGPSPRYAVIAASGSPGSNGANGLSAQSVGITSSSLTMNTARILGRTSAGSGAIQELTAGSNLSLASGSLDLAANLAVSGASASTSTTTGSITVAGGIGVGANSYFGGKIVVSGGTNRTRVRQDNTIIDFTDAAESAYAPGTVQGSTLSLVANNGEGLLFDSLGRPIFNMQSTAATLTTNGTLTITLVSNTQLRFSARGSDGVTRTNTLTLS